MFGRFYHKMRRLAMILICQCLRNENYVTLQTVLKRGKKRGLLRKKQKQQIVCF